MRRRRFTQSAAALHLLALGDGILESGRTGAAALADSAFPAELRADLAVIGGGTGGVAAALAAARNGLTVVVTEPTDWIGGQLTSQAVPPDENRWIETTGCTRSYREFRNRVRDYYRRNYPLTPQVRAIAQLNPGGGAVSRLCHEPRVALAVMTEMLAPHVASGRVRILTRTTPIAADVDGDRVRSATVRRIDGGNIVLSAACFIDATELGDLLPLTGTEYVCGAESQAQTGERRAAEVADPDNVQSFTWCFPVEYRHDEDFTIEKPEDWEFFRDYVPDLKPAWTGKLLDWRNTHPVTLEPRVIPFDPRLEAPGLWLYRRIVNKANFTPGTFDASVTLVNWPQNDYWLGNIIDKPADVVARHLRGARQLSLCLLYWMQTEAPRPDGGVGWPGLRLRPELVGTDDGLAMAPYIRESRRIRAKFTVTEAHVGLDMRRKPGIRDDEVRAEPFADSVGIGHYRIDLHPSTGGDNYIDVASLPFQIPLGSLVPVRMRNLLAGCKNLGVTHVTNGCYRLHPVEWNIGESAGALAAYCLRRKTEPPAVCESGQATKDFQKSLSDQGVLLAWPDEIFAPAPSGALDKPRRV